MGAFKGGLIVEQRLNENIQWERLPNDQLVMNDLMNNGNVARAGIDGLLAAIFKRHRRKTSKAKNG